MSSSVIYATLLYFVVFRLLIILVGGLSIYLGYRLFSLAMHSSVVTTPKDEAVGLVGKNNSSEIAAKFGESSLTLRNAAPGTVFAAFGAITIIVVLAGSPPTFDYSSEGGQTSESQGKEQVKEAASDASMADFEESAAVTEKAKVTVRLRDEEFPDSAEAAHTLGGKHFRRLLQLEEHAVALAPDGAEYLDSLAGLYFLAGKYEEAFQYQQKAVQSSPGEIDFQKRLAAYEHALQ